MPNIFIWWNGAAIKQHSLNINEELKQAGKQYIYKKLDSVEQDTFFSFKGEIKEEDTMLRG